MNKVTIITPVYNGARYLKSSVGSVFRQTYPCIELIAINDGSSDNSLEVLQKLAAKAPETVDMKVIDQENAGICTTRNLALDMAAGDYVMFLDQDDLLKKEAAASLVRSIREDQSDMVIGGYDLLNQEDQILDKWTLRPEDEWSKFRITAPWGRLFRRDVIEENHIRFMQTKISEDFYFNLVYMSCCRKITIAPYRIYGWRYSETSESHANMSQLSDDRNPLIMMSRVLEDMKPDSILKSEYVEYMMIKHIVWYLFFTARSASPDMLNTAYANCFRWLKDHFPAYASNPLLGLRTPQGETLQVRGIVTAAVLLHRCRLLLPLLKIYRKI